ncbi:unnamed protein product [Paramecium primaurelia]|uniref:Transmembrane protein n=1 Tax=Paramecium primaurelia TaxID=5886 RepID=A0A8S1NYV4_PARPR|nr:unnamed protein product [Paramecium primaurelia]
MSFIPSSQLIHEQLSIHQSYQKQVEDMKKKNLAGSLWEIVKKMSRKKEKKDKWNENYFSEFSQNINFGALQCFSELCTELACNNKITEVNLSRCNINIYQSMELANLVQKNTNIQVLQLAGCNLNSFSLSCIFKSMIDHTGLTHLNLSNNKGFTKTSIDDFCKYVLKGKNPLFEINLSFCNLDNSSLSLILPNLKHLRSLKRFIISLVNLKSSESILALSSAINNYTGNKFLDYLDISWNWITNQGLELLNLALFMSVRHINIRSLNLEYNQLTQDCIVSLETILLKLNIEEINLSKNKLSEFQNQQVLNKKMSKIDLSYNRFEEIPQNFFLNVLSLNLSNNSIKTQGAYQISQVVSSKRVMWMELNLNNNEICTQGFISLIYALRENQRIISISVANNNIKGEGILVYIFNHEQLNLQYLDISYNYLRYDLVYALISMMKECQLKKLVLSKLRQDENDICSGREELIEIKCNNLRQLDFSQNTFMIQSILNSLSKQFNKIEYLNLNDCEINQTNLIDSLSSFLSNTQTLQTLLLARNNLGKMDEKNFKTLNDGFFKNNSIMYLDLSSNKLKIKLLSLIPGLSNCRYLKYLNISNNLIYETKNLIKDFAKLLDNINLQYLDISRNQIGGQTLLYARKKLQKQCRQFPQIKMQNQKLTADDLQIITQIISESYSIKRLELQDNDSLDQMNNIMLIGNNIKIESLSINKILFRYDSFRNLIRIIQENFRNIRFLEISNTLLFQEQLIELFKTIKLIKNLNVFILDYQSFQQKDDKIIDALYSCQNCFLNLKHFSVRKSTLTYSFYVFVSELLRKSQKLIELDLSGNVINKNDFQILCNGLFSNSSVQVLNLKNCRLTDESLIQLIPCLHDHSAIKDIDISQNEISLRFLLQINEIIRNYKTSIKTLKLQNIQIFWDVESIQNELSFINILKNLNHIDLSINYKQNENIIKVLDYFIKIKTLDNIQILTLNNCGIMDDQCQTLANFIKDNKIIREASFIQNNITSKGFKHIFDLILSNKSSLITLNIQKNYIDEQYFQDLTAADIIPLTYFQLLIIDGNNFKRHAQGISLILNRNPRLYIFNNWIDVTEIFAQQIINQYVLFASQLNLNKEVPHYLKQLIIRNTNLSDQFFIWFGSQYFKFPYLEIIDFRGSTKHMTSMSKMHMYIDIINEYLVNYNIQEVCFDQNQAYQLNQFDDGLFKYWLLNLKVFLQNKNQISLSKLEYYGNQIEKVKWGKIGKWLVHLINKSLNIIQSLNYDFRFSSSLHSFTRQSLTKIRIYLIIVSIIEIIKIFIGVGSLQMRMNFKDNLLKCQTTHNLCFQNDLHWGFMGEISIYVTIILAQTIATLFIAIKIRLIATPDYCIQTTEMIRFQRFKFPHKKELWLCILQLIIWFTYLLECRIIGSNMEILAFIKDSQMDIIMGLKNKIIMIISFMTSFLLLKAIFQIYITFKSLLLFISTARTDSANILQSLMLKVQSDHMLNIEYVINNFCPQSGIYIKGKLWNYKQIFQSIHGFVEFAILINLILLAKYRRDLLNEQRVSNMFTSSDVITIISYVFSSIKILMHLYFALLSRPPQLKVSDLNEALLLRRYQKLGNQLQIVKQKPNKEFYQSSLKSISKNSYQDFKFGSNLNSKGDISIVLQKNTINSVDKAIDYIEELIQLPMDPIKCKSMKSIRLNT